MTIEVVGFGGWPNCIRSRTGRSNSSPPRTWAPDHPPGLRRRTEPLPQLPRDAGLRPAATRLAQLRRPPSVARAGGRPPDLRARQRARRAHSWDGATLVLRNTERANGLEKELRVTVSPARRRSRWSTGSSIRNPWAVELAAWALSVMAPGGRAIYPQEEFRPHPDVPDSGPAAGPVAFHGHERSALDVGPQVHPASTGSAATTKQKAGLLNKAGLGRVRPRRRRLHQALPMRSRGDLRGHGLQHRDLHRSRTFSRSRPSGR